MWDGTNDPRGKDIMKAIKNEVPAFCHYIDHYELPLEVQGRRFGVATWQHPEIAEAATAGNPSDVVAEVISAIIHDSQRNEELLKSRSGLSSTEVAEILINGSPRIPQGYLPQIGNYLKYVKSNAQRRPECGFTIETRKVKGITKWVFSVSETVAEASH